MFCAEPHGRPFFRMLSRPGASDPSSARRKPGHFSVPSPSPRTPSASLLRPPTPARAYVRPRPTSPPFSARRKASTCSSRLRENRSPVSLAWRSAATSGHAAARSAIAITSGPIRITEQPKTRGDIAAARRPSFSRSHSRSVFRVVDARITAKSFVKARKYVPHFRHARGSIPKPDFLKRGL
jgi:hypothetical protein